MFICNQQFDKILMNNSLSDELNSPINLNEMIDEKDLEGLDDEYNEEIRNKSEKEEFNFYDDYTDIYLEYNYDSSLDDNIKGKLGYYLSILQTQRNAIIQWMSELCEIYQLSLDTLSLSAYTFDKFIYLSSFKQKPLISHLQLIASCCLLIASKYEDGHYPAISELMYMCDGLYKKNDFLKMQDHILATLNYRLTRFDARFNARLKLAKMEALEKAEIEDNFFVSVDFVFKSSLFSPFLTFISINNLGDSLIDTTSESDISDDTPNKSIKMYIIDALEIAQELQENT